MVVLIGIIDVKNNLYKRVEAFFAERREIRVDRKTNTPGTRLHFKFPVAHPAVGVGDSRRRLRKRSIA